MLRFITLLLSIILPLTVHSAFAENDSRLAITQPVPVSQLAEYSSQPKAVQELILKAQHLSEMNLTYLYGSANPVNKGMDCSGTMYYLLSQYQLKDLPRQSDELFNWLEKNGTLHKVTSNSFDSLEFFKMKPGDLLFWSGTYDTGRESRISHVMLYLGKNQAGERLMFGASDGRTYLGKKDARR